ncbi:hypothetical protein [Muribacter muris]|nr:hypothetical protein [Muribacter muris]
MIKIFSLRLATAQNAVHYTPKLVQFKQPKGEQNEDLGNAAR